jgi:hypothetical protein
MKVTGDVGLQIQKYLVKETGGRVRIDVLNPRVTATVPVNPPDCELGKVLVEIFGRWPGRS